MRQQPQFLSFWSINAELELGELKRQLDQLKKAGLDGVVFHPRYYPDRPAYMSEPYLAVVSDLILYAKSISMTFWLYDENGWPSGTAGGAVLRLRGDLRCRSVRRVPRLDGSYELKFDSKEGVSSFDQEATHLFIGITHERYRQGLAPEAFDYVEGFFSDEVGFLDGHGVTVKEGGVPWDERLPQMYRERYGEELLPALGLLFEEGDGGEATRTRYWELLTDLLADGFYRPIADWCSKYGKRFTAHLKAEEHPYFQLSYSGSCLQMLREVETPAIDALERYPGNDYYPRVAFSVAMQQGRDGCLAEAMGGSGWGITPETFVDYALWLTGHGIDRIVLHLNQLRLKTAAVQDWPPSMPCHLTWQAAFPAMLQEVKRRAALQPDLRKEPDVLIVTPTRGIMAGFLAEEAQSLNEHDGSNVPETRSGRVNAAFLRLVEEIHGSGLHYELSEERSIEQEGELADGKLWIGRRGYAVVIVAEGCRWNDEALIVSMRERGVTILNSDNWRTTLGDGFAGTSGEGAQAEENGAGAAMNAGVRMRAGAELGGLASAEAEDTTGYEQDERYAVVLKQTRWRAKAPADNTMMLQMEIDDGKLVGEAELLAGATPGRVRLQVLDEVADVAVNGLTLPLRCEAEGYVADIPAALLRGERLRFELRPLDGGEPEPMAFLKGDFSVLSRTGYEEKDARQLSTTGPFVLTELRDPEPGDLIASGLPFSGEPVILTKTLDLGGGLPEGAHLELRDVHGAAAQVRLGGRELGWCWGPRWTVPAGSAVIGQAELSVTLYPSTFNLYGPHRHIDGDRQLTSPDQYRGIKNFADDPDAPEHTLGERWQFVRCGIGENVFVRISFNDNSSPLGGGGVRDGSWQAQDGAKAVEQGRLG